MMAGQLCSGCKYTKESAHFVILSLYAYFHARCFSRMNSRAGQPSLWPPSLKRHVPVNRIGYSKSTWHHQFPIVGSWNPQVFQSLEMLATARSNRWMGIINGLSAIMYSHTAQLYG
jgi:hypothetical protein